MDLLYLLSIVIVICLGLLFLVIKLHKESSFKSKIISNLTKENVTLIQKYYELKQDRLQSGLD